MAKTAAAAAGTINITELTGKRRQIALSQRAKPFQPLSFETEHRINETLYNGYPRTSQQPLGAKDNASDWKGAWHTRFVGDPGQSGSPVYMATVAIPFPSASLTDSGIGPGLPIATAADLAELFDDLCRQGQVCTVQWLHLKRVGRLAKFGQDWKTPHDVEWTMQWKWIGRDEDAGLPSPSGATVTGVTQQLKTAYMGLYSATDFDGMPDIEPRFADYVDRSVGIIQLATSGLEDALALTTTSSIDAVAATRRVLAIASFVADQADTFIGAVGSLPGPSMRLPATLLPSSTGFRSLVVASGDLTGVLPGAAFASNISAQLAIQQARRVKHVAGRQRWQALRDVDGSPLAVTIVAQDQDLRMISQRYYNTPGEAELIRSFNNLGTYSPPAGSVVVIPQRSNQS